MGCHLFDENCGWRAMYQLGDHVYITIDRRGSTSDIVKGQTHHLHGEFTIAFYIDFRDWLFQVAFERFTTRPKVCHFALIHVPVCNR